MSQPQLNSLYQALILDHYRNPRNKTELDNHTVEVHMANPVCGDEIKLQLELDDANEEIVRASFKGQGCSISQAAVSMMTVLLAGRRIDEAEAIAGRFTEMMKGDESAARDKSLGDLRALQGVSKFPVRIKCALLGFDALQEALKKAGLGEAH
jgi:nitrogen fixation NifU-like protein